MAQDPFKLLGTVQNRALSTVVTDSLNASSNLDELVQATLQQTQEIGLRYTQAHFDLQHAADRFSNCTLTLLANNGDVALLTLTGDVCIVKSGCEVAYQEGGVAATRKKLVLPSTRLSNEKSRLSLCTHQQVDSHTLKPLDELHGGRRGPNATYLDGFLNLFVHHTGSVLLRGDSARQRRMDAYFNLAEFLGYWLGTIGPNGMTRIPASELLQRLETGENVPPYILATYPTNVLDLERIFSHINMG